MIACSSMALWPWYWPEGSHNGPKPKAIPLQATYSIFTNWLLCLPLNPGINQVSIGTYYMCRPFLILLGHYGSAIMDCASPVF